MHLQAMRDLPPCERLVGLNTGGWLSYTTLAKHLRELGVVRAKPWVLIAAGCVEVCCWNHNPDDFNGGRRFRINRDKLLAFDAEARLGQVGARWWR